MPSATESAPPGGSASSDDLTSAEYDALRQELLMLLKLRYEILIMTTTLVGAVLGYALTTNSPQLPMIPLVLILLLLASATMTFFQTRHSERIAAYIGAVVETRATGLTWQRCVARHKVLFHPWSYSKPLACTYGILGLLPIFLFASLGEYQCFAGRCHLGGLLRSCAFAAACGAYSVLLWNYFRPGPANLQDQWTEAAKHARSHNVRADAMKGGGRHGR